MALELRAVSKLFPTHAAVQDLSLTLEPGEFFSLVGPSGCGKTTTLRMVAGFEQPSAGQIFLNGQLLNPLAPQQRNVSTVFQNYALFPHLTVAENVAFGLRRRGVRNPAPQVAEALRSVHLEGKDARKPAELSGGERQRVALARSLVLKPDILLLDEPLAALDPQLRRQVRAELKTLQRNAGITFLFVTHDQEEALSLSDRVGIMNAGTLQQVARPEEAYHCPASHFVASFLGEVNIIGRTPVRPERTRLSITPQGQAIECQVGAATFFGHATRVTVLHQHQTITAELLPHQAPLEPGTVAYLYWARADELPLPR